MKIILKLIISHHFAIKRRKIAIKPQYFTNFHPHHESPMQEEFHTSNFIFIFTLHRRSPLNKVSASCYHSQVKWNIHTTISAHLLREYNHGMSPCGRSGSVVDGKHVWKMRKLSLMSGLGEIQNSNFFLCSKWWKIIFYEKH